MPKLHLQQLKFSKTYNNQYFFLIKLSTLLLQSFNTSCMLKYGYFPDGKLHFPSSSQKLYSLEIKIRDFFFAAASLKIKAQNCLPQDWLLVGNPEVGNSWLHLCKLQTRMH